MSTLAGTPAPPVPETAAPDAHGLRRWVWAAAGATAAAGVLHAFAAVDHLGSGELVVGFFLVTALGQLAAATGLAVAAATGQRPASGPLAALLALTVALLALYLVAHTTDLLSGVTAVDVPDDLFHEHVEPTGPVALGSAPTHGEPAEVLGTATVAVQLLSVLAFTALLPARSRRLAGNVLAGLGAAAWLLWLTGVLG